MKRFLFFTIFLASICPFSISQANFWNNINFALESPISKNFNSPVLNSPSPTCTQLQSSQKDYFTICNSQDYDHVCFDGNGAYQGCSNTSNNRCTQNNPKSATNLWCAIPQQSPPQLNCTILKQQQAQYFQTCSDQSYDNICFDKNGNYQGCVDSLNNRCTQNNPNASTNIMCSTDNPGPQITITKNAFPGNGSTVEKGQPLSYFLQIFNPTRGPLENISITDFITNNIDIDETRIDPACSWNNSSRILTCNFAFIPSQTASRTIQIFTKVDANATSGFCNQAIATVRERRFASDMVCHNLQMQAPSISKDATPPRDSNVKPGDSITYHLTVNNPLPINLENAIIRDNFPQGLDITLIGDARTLCSFNPNSRLLTCSLNINSNSSKEIDIRGTVQNNSGQQRICNQASVEINDNQYDSFSICHTIETNVPLLSCSDLEGTENQFFTMCGDQNYDHVCFDKNGTYQGCYNEIDNNCTQNNANAFTNIGCKVINGAQKKTCEELKTQNPFYFTTCGQNNFDHVCFDKNGGYQGCFNITHNTCTENNPNALTNIACEAEKNGTTPLTCSDIKKTNPFFFDVCTDQGFETVCFDKNGIYQGCGMKDKNICTENNPNGKTNILCNLESGSGSSIISLIKSASPAPDTNLNTNDNLTYTILVKNTTQSQVQNITINDALPSGFQFTSVTPASCSFTGNVTNIVHCEISTLDTTPLEITIKGTISEKEKIQMCNQAEFMITNQNKTGTSNKVCHQTNEGNPETSPIGGGGGGGGSAPTQLQIGLCSYISADDPLSRWQCRPSAPQEPTALYTDPYWNEYQTCKNKTYKNNTNAEQICLQQWAELHGSICGPTAGTGNILIPYPGNVSTEAFNTDYKNQIAHQCDPFSKMEKLLRNACANGSLQMDAFIEKKIPDASRIARGENVDYEINVALKNHSAQNIHILQTPNTKIKVYDFTIPSDSGNLWYRDEITNQSREWTMTSPDGQTWTASRNPDQLDGGVLFERPFTSKEIYDLQNNNRELKLRPLDYQMGADIFENQDIAKLDNMAFAVAQFQYEIETIDPTGQIKKSGPYFFEQPISQKEKNICDELKSVSSVGDMQSLSDANIEVIRPYLETKGGGNLGLNINDANNHVFGNKEVITGVARNKNSSGKIFEQQNGRFGGETNDFQKIGNLNNNEQISQDQFFKTLENNAKNTEEKIGITWNTTPDNAGIYFTKGDITINNANDITQSATFVIEGNLTITGNFILPKNVFVAFIMKNGNLIIDKNVDQIQGIFITENGEILSDGDSEKQLILSGGMMGDARDLIGSRHYIGTANNLEPSIKIIFDARLLDNTPPAMEQFLGKNWKQSAE